MPLNREHLHDYQLKAIDFIKTEERCALFLDMGLGKTTSTLTAVSDLQDEFAVNKTLVIAPLRVANSTWKQEVEKWRHLEHLKVSVCTGSEKTRRSALHRDADIYVINRENVLWLVDLYKKKWPFDCVVVDECFTGDTEVLTPSGPLPIKNISVGEIVMTSNGPEKVSRVFKKKATRLVRVELDDGTKIECTPEHPFATELGWVQAVDTKGLRVLRSEVQDEGQDKQVLQQKLFEKSHVGIENRFGKKEDCRKSIGEFEGARSLEQRDSLVQRSSEKTERCPQVERSQTKNSWGERAYRPVRKTNDGDVVLGLDASAYNPNQSAEGEWLPNVLQSGFCGSNSENDNRSGRGISQIAQASGRKEGQFSKISRVVDVESIQCESPRIVYNLETDGVHDYFAGSTLVHNCSSFKNPSAKRFRALKKVLPYTNYMVLLTGTPSPNSLLDLWPQMYLVDFGERLGRTVTGYRQRFFEQDYMGYRYTIRDGAADKIHRLLSDKVISMNADDYLEVPERIDLTSPVQLPPAAMKKYKELEKTLLAQLDTGEEVEAITAAALANKMLQFSNGAAYYDDKKNWGEVHKEKLDALSDIVDDNPSENILVAYNYKFDLERLMKKFPQAVVLDKKQETIDRWNRGEIKMLLAHPASAGHGLNLQSGGSMIVWFGLNWSLELYQQFNARLHRQGQTKPVRIMHIIAEGTIDERVLQVLGDKDATQASLLKSLKA